MGKVAKLATISFWPCLPRFQPTCTNNTTRYLALSALRVLVKSPGGRKECQILFISVSTPHCRVSKVPTTLRNCCRRFLYYTKKWELVLHSAQAHVLLSDLRLQASIQYEGSLGPSSTLPQNAFFRPFRLVTETALHATYKIYQKLTALPHACQRIDLDRCKSLLIRL